MNCFSVNKSYLDKIKPYSLPEDILEKAILIEYSKGEILCMEGEPFEYLLFLISGKVKVCISGANGKSLLLSFYSPGTILGEVELMLDGIGTTDVTAITKAVCIGIPLRICQERLTNDLDFMRTTATAVSKIVVLSAKNTARNVLYTLENRLCAYIVETNENGYFEETLTETAELLGTSYRHLLRTMTSLCEENILSKCSRTRYKIVNNEQLKSKAKDCFLF